MEELLIMAALLLLGGGDTAEEPSNGAIPLPPPPPKPKPKPSVVDLGEVKPLPPKPVVPQAVPVPQGKIVISSDCKTAELKPGWEDTIAAKVEQAVAQGAGQPLFAPQDAAKSVDALIRTVVSEQTGNGCINNAPWLDRYASQNPIPQPEEGEATFDYYKRLAQWDDQWDSTFKAWAQANPQAFQAFKEIGGFIVGRWAAETGVSPRGPGAPGPTQAIKSIPKAKRAADTNQLRMLGYDITPIATEEFQEDFNMVKDYQTNFGWTQFGMALEIDNKFGPLTRAAMQEALALANNSSQTWSLLLQSAREGLGA